MEDTVSHGKKRKKKFYVGAPAGGKRPRCSNLLDSNSGQGFLVTINPKQERRATLSAYSLLNDAADRLYGQQKEQSQVPNSEHSTADNDIEAELKDLRAKNQRFSKLRTEIPSIIFISTELPKPQEISTDVFEHMPSTVQNIFRLVPVLATCKTQPECVIKK
ncbi:THUMP domain-containing protein 1-like, partial [Tropilaelaps mercedesae]